MIAVAIVVGNNIVEVRSYLVGFPQAHFVLLFADTENWGSFRLMSALPSKADIRIGSAYRPYFMGSLRGRYSRSPHLFARLFCSTTRSIVFTCLVRMRSANSSGSLSSPYSALNAWWS